MIPLFEKLLLMFQKGSPAIHVLYDSICDILVKLMRRFLIADAIEQKYGSNLTTIECFKRKLQLLDKELVIGDSAEDSHTGNSSILCISNLIPTTEVATEQ